VIIKSRQVWRLQPQDPCCRELMPCQEAGYRLIQHEILDVDPSSKFADLPAKNAFGVDIGEKCCSCECGAAGRGLKKTFSFFSGFGTEDASKETSEHTPQLGQ
jgi:hypothetical protein